MLYKILSGKVSSRHFCLYVTSLFFNKDFESDTVSPDDSTWLSHLSEPIKCHGPERSLMTEDAADLVSQVSFNFTIRIDFDAIA
jgi:hypothetical protein